MSWGGFILTNAGRNLLAKVQAGEMAELNITRFGIGDGNYSGSYNTIANLVSQKQSVPLRAKKAKAQYVNIEGYFSNEGLAEGFYFREWGIFAMNGAQEILYAYDNAGTDAEYVAPDGSIRYEKLLKAALVITVDVNVTIDTSGVVYATVEELKNYLLTVGDGKDVTVTFEEAEIETDIKSGDKLSVMFGKILKKFKTVTSNIGNKADLITVDKDNLVDAINEVKTQNNHLDANKADKTELTIYEKGVWTPIIRINSSTEGITYANQTGEYVRIGNIVYITASITLSSKGTNIGNVEMVGLPFSRSSGLAYLQTYQVNTNVDVSQNVLYAIATSTGTLLKERVSNTFSNVTNTDLNDNSRFYINGFYYI